MKALRLGSFLVLGSLAFGLAGCGGDVGDPMTAEDQAKADEMARSAAYKQYEKSGKKGPPSASGQVVDPSQAAPAADEKDKK